MPVMVQHEVEARTVQKGDALHGQYPVTARLVKNKFTYIHYETGGPLGEKVLRVEHHHLVTVGRLELTPEEQAVKDAEMLKERKAFFVKQVQEYPFAAVAAVEAAEAKQKERREAGWGLLDHYTMDQLMVAWAAADLGREIQAVFSSAADGTFHLHEGECTYEWVEAASGGGRVCTVKSVYTQYDVAVHIVNRMIQRLTARAMGMRVLSRSTSVTSNLCEDLATHALAEFVRSLEYSSHGLPEVQLPSRYM